MKTTDGAIAAYIWGMLGAGLGLGFGDAVGSARGVLVEPIEETRRTVTASAQAPTTAIPTRRRTTGDASGPGHRERTPVGSPLPSPPVSPLGFRGTAASGLPGELSIAPA
jgi:hypothetical protein